MEHAVLVNGAPVLIEPQPITDGSGVQHPAAIFRLWTRAEKLAVGLYEVRREDVPDGQQATAWTFVVVGDEVVGTPTLESIPPPPPDPVRMTLILAGKNPDVPDEEVVGETPVPFSSLVPGTFYPLDFLVDVEGTTYAVARDNGFYYGGWSAQSLISLGHLVLAAPPSSPQPWVQPTGAQDAYAVETIVTHNGSDWWNRRASNVNEPGTTQAGWLRLTPDPAAWIHIGNEGYPPLHPVSGQPMRVIHNGTLWRNDAAGNFWEPGVAIWTNEGPAP